MYGSYKQLRTMSQEDTRNEGGKLGIILNLNDNALANTGTKILMERLQVHYCRKEKQTILV